LVPLGFNYYLCIGHLDKYGKNISGIKYVMVGGGLGEPGFPNNYKFSVFIKKGESKKKLKYFYWYR
jgi:hypothetical protein